MYKAIVITLSDRGYRGEREDLSGPALAKVLEANGYPVKRISILPDDRILLKDELVSICDNCEAELVITTGGTGLSPRDWTPEATREIIEREVPGISEWIRYKSMEITGRAMLSRGISGVRNRTLIVNVPGSPKGATESLGFVIDQVEHALDTLTGKNNDCGRK